MSPTPADTLLGLGLLLAASMFAERFPVPVEGADAGGVSLLYVFVVATVVIFGWQTGALLAAIGTFTQLLQHRPTVRVIYNAAVFGIAAAVAGAAIHWLNTDNVAELLAAVGIAAFVDYWVNLLLITLVVAVHSKRSFIKLVRTNMHGTIIPFALMASAALMLVVLWQRSPVLSAALLGPLIAISLYQRSTHRALRAMRLALTDPLTGLGNHRHFHERLQRELIAAEEAGEPLSLCLIDVDDFKRINDRYGHPAGDRVLSQVATRLRQGGEAFRLGGDEFAVLLPEHDEPTALDTATSIIERLRAMELEHNEQITVSAGVATFPVQGVGRDELIRLADSALYWAKEHGKNRVRVYRPEVVELAELKKLASGADRAARFRAAASLAKAVDARDVYTGSHSERVADLAGSRRRAHGPDPGARRADPARREPARPRQARHPRGDPPQARPAHRSRAARARASSADRLPDAREPRRDAGRRMGPPPPRALGRHRLSRRAARRRHPARRAHHLRRRRVRRDDERPRLPQQAQHRGGGGGARVVAPAPSSIPTRSPRS